MSTQTATGHKAATAAGVQAARMLAAMQASRALSACALAASSLRAVQAGRASAHATGACNG